mgnify:CR=1 FL=1
MVCPRLQGILRQRLRYLFEKTIVNSDHEKFVSMAHDYPILKRQLFFTDHYLCLSLYTGNKVRASPILQPTNNHTKAPRAVVSRSCSHAC